MNKNALSQFFIDSLNFPSLGRGMFCVWRRNFLYFQYTLFTALTWIFIEPLLYLFALGYGLGQFVTEINGQSYAQFIAPAMMATTGMFVSYFEGTYATYTKFARQNTFQTMILTPVSSDEVVVGEILWCTSKAFFSVLSVGAILIVMGLVDWRVMPSILVVLLLMSWVFAAFGIWLAGLAKSYEWFSYSQSGFITPMSLFCGTYFPFSQLPDGLQAIAYALPLTHAMQTVRMIIAGEFSSTIILHMMYLLFAGIIFTNLAVSRFQRKLIT